MRRALGSRYSNFSRDETEWGAFGDPRGGFGASVVSYDQNAMRSGFQSSPASAPLTINSTARTPLAAPISVYNQNAMRGLAPTPSSSPAAPVSTLLQAAAGSTPKPTGQIYVNPAAGTKDLLPNILALVASAALPNAPPLPASVTRQVSFAPFPLASKAVVSRTPTPARPSSPVAVPSTPLPPTPPSTIAVVQARKQLGKVYPGAQQPGFVRAPVMPAGLIHRVAPSPSAPVIDMRGVSGFLTWSVNNRGVITEGANPLDTSMPQWWVYGTGRVVRYG
jgi:hypothetical protein